MFLVPATHTRHNSGIREISMLKAILIALLAGTFAHGAMAINKCTGPDGRAVYQDKPCAGAGGAIVVKPATGPALAAPTSTGTSEADRLNASVAHSQNERKRLSLERRGVPDAHAATLAFRSHCKAELARLDKEKQSADTRPTGQAWATRLASEQASMAVQCSTRDRELTHEHNQALKECQDLGGCSGGKTL